MQILGGVARGPTEMGSAGGISLFLCNAMGSSEALVELGFQVAGSTRGLRRWDRCPRSQGSPGHRRAQVPPLETRSSRWRSWEVPMSLASLCRRLQSWPQRVICQPFCAFSLKYRYRFQKICARTIAIPKTHQKKD